ncbi:MAG: site-specific integrase [Chlamydiales bacterium]
MAVIEERKTKDGVTRYRVKIRLKGYPPQTETHQRLGDAKRWARETEAAILEGRHFKTSEAKKHTLGELVDRYIRDVLPQKKKSEKKQTAQLLWWKERIGTHLLADVTPALIAEKRDELFRGMTFRGTQRSPATVVRYLSALSHALTVAVKEWGWIEDSPMRKVSKLKEARGRVRFLDDEERERLLRACRESANPHLYPVVLLALSTGMRHGEIINLTWADVDIPRKRIILQETKNGERRAVPIAGGALDVLARLEKSRRIDTNLLFPKVRSITEVVSSSDLTFEQVDLRRVQKVQKPAELRGAWVAAMKKAGLRDFRFHDLRHCAASYLAMSGASLAEIADILGHKTLAMVKRYAHLSDSHKHTVVDRMNKHFLGAEA